MLKLLRTLALLGAAAAAGAQTPPADHAAHHPAAAASAVPTAAFDRGEVRKVDKAANRLTIKHGEIKRLAMPPMTMAYAVRNAAWLDKLKPGDKIRFKAEKAPLGDYIVTDLVADR